MPKTKKENGTVVLPLEKRQSTWAAAHLAEISRSPVRAIPRITSERAGEELGELDLWDMWPVETADGQLFESGGTTFWMILSAPRLVDPEFRHDVARIRLLTMRNGGWTDQGLLFPDGFTPGSREWSGSAIIDSATGRLTVFFTAAGQRDESDVSVEQRIFQSSGDMQNASDRILVSDWTSPKQCFVSDPANYEKVGRGKPMPGKIKAFRDPAYFRDPASGEEYLFFTGSAAGSESPYNGVIGVAIKANDNWVLRPPVISADGVNNELERPHMRYINGAYYLFWSTHSKVFAPGTTAAPTGLYGMVGKSPLGPFEPLNRSALVAPNPDSAPFQSYSWWVLSDLRVCSFVDYPLLQKVPDLVPAGVRRTEFGGVPAPFFTLSLNGPEASIVGS